MKNHLFVLFFAGWSAVAAQSTTPGVHVPAPNASATAKPGVHLPADNHPTVSPVVTTATTSPASPTSTTRTPVQVVPETASDRYFDAALSAFRTRKYTEAGRQIMNGAEALRLEAPYTEAPGERKILYQRLNDLVALSEQVEAGKVHEDDVLLTAFQNAQLSVVHRYYLVTNNLIAPGGDDVTEVYLDNLRHHLLADAKYQPADKSAQLQTLAQRAESLSYQISNLHGKPLTPTLTGDLQQLLDSLKTLNLP